MKNIQAIFIGASAGGITAIIKLLDILPADFAVPIVVIQHLHRGTEMQFPLIFGQKRGDRVREAVEKESLLPGHIYFAPPDYHLLFERDRSFSLSQDEPVYFSRPSIDVAFESAALAFGGGACGIILTGANEDGAQGLRAIHDVGGTCMVQSLDSAEYTAMPLAATRLVKPDFVGDIEAIAHDLQKRTERKGGV